MLQIIIKEVKDYLRDKSYFFFYLIFPVILVFLLGNLLSSMDYAEEAVGEVKIHYGIETGSQFDILSIKNFIKGVEDNGNIHFEETGDLEESVWMAGKGDIDAVVLFKNEPLEINIYEGSDRVKNRTVSSMMNGFTQYNKAMNIIVKSNPKALMASADNGEKLIGHKDLGARTMLDYYAITMMAMLCFMSVIMGAMCFIGERQGKTIRRLKIAPIGQVKLFFAKVFGMLPQTILQVVILMITSTLLFDAHYASNFLDNLYLFLMFVMVSFAMISFGVVYGLFVNVNPMTTIMPVIWVMMFLSGTYSKEIFIKGISELLPIYQVQEAAFDLTLFGRHQKANTVIIVSLVLSVIFLVIGAAGFRRKEEK